MFDPVPVIVQALLTDDRVATWTEGRIFGGSIPEGSVPPLIVVMLSSTRPTALPSTEWTDFLVTVDVQAEDSGVSYQIALATVQAISKIVGSVTDGVVSSTEVTGTTADESGAFTPTRFRNVLSVEMTARHN